MKILVISNSSRSIICSARKAGHEVYALDHFCDVDLLRCAKKAEILDNISETRINELAESCDAVITGPGFEKLRFKNMLNNSPRVMEEANDKLKIAEKFRSMGIHHPQTSMLNKVSGFEFPLIIKPRVGSGGMRNILIKNEDELAFFYRSNDPEDYIAQEFVKGIPCSASLISTGDDAVVIALNEQLIGSQWLTRLPFAYCGNITPFHTKFDNEMIEYAQQIALEFKLRGSNGVDFILNEKGVFIIEINPRFQGSLDTIELSTGMNIFDSHVKSFAGELQEAIKASRFAAKAIAYANKNVFVTEDISNRLVECLDNGMAADIPRSGSVINVDEPVTTLLGTGNTRNAALEKVRKSAYYIKSMTEG